MSKSKDENDLRTGHLSDTFGAEEPLPGASDGVSEQDLADMVEFANNDEEAIDWAFWIGKMPRWTAYQAVRLMAALDPAKHANLSFKRNEAAGVAKERAKRLELLAESHRKTEATPAEWLAWANDLREQVHSGFRIALADWAAMPAQTDNARGPRRAAPSEDGTAKRERQIYSVGATPETSQLHIGGRNSPEALTWHIGKRAREMFGVDTSLTKRAIATEIAGELERAGHAGERGYLSAARIERLLPSGFTGGRAKNGKKGPST